MTIRAVCEKCNHEWDLEMKPMEKEHSRRIRQGVNYGWQRKP